MRCWISTLFLQTCDKFNVFFILDNLDTVEKVLSVLTSAIALCSTFIINNISLNAHFWIITWGSLGSCCKYHKQFWMSLCGSSENFHIQYKQPSAQHPSYRLLVGIELWLGTDRRRWMSPYICRPIISIVYLPVNSISTSPFLSSWWCAIQFLI